MLQKEIWCLCNFSSLKIVKIKPTNKVQSLFSKWSAFSARKRSLFHIVHFTNWNGMNQSFPCRYGPIQHSAIFFYFLEKYLKKLFVLRALLLNENNSSYHYNSYNKGPNLAFFSFIESPSNSLLTIKFPKIQHTSSSYNKMHKTTMAKIWPLMGFRG
jgi:hypothetical protein